jgi:type I restriction enzyme S subunit
MNAEMLLKHFDRIAEAPDAVARLRRFVLDLAVRGKLVAQEPDDEPAEELLERIRVEKARLVKEGRERKERAMPSDGEDTPPFELPNSWQWSRLAAVGFISPRNVADDDLLASFVPMPMISADYGVPNQHEVRPWGEIKSGYTHFAEGDVSLAKITPCFENGKSTVFRHLTGGIGAGTTDLHVVRPAFVAPDYILIFLKSPHFIGSGIPRMIGTAGQKRVPAAYFAQSPFPLPPLAEQHRIVAKVDELMTLCDRLEAARDEREARRDRLVAASLHRIGTAPAAESEAQEPDQTTPTFPAAARFHLDRLTRLATRPEHIRQLRQTILRLAVSGRLVSPRASEAAPVLDVASLGKANKNFDRQIFEESAAEISLPSHWCTVPLVKAAEEIVDCPHSTPQWTNTGKLCVRTSQFRPGYLDLSDPQFVSPSTYEERIQRLKPVEGDILYSREGGVLGVACRVPPGVELCLGQRMMLIRGSKLLSPAFLEMVLNSPFVTGIARRRTTGGAAPRVNVSTVKAYPIPLLPLAEQHRIVAKVDELMAFCDQLEAQLTATEADSRRLLDAVLRDALAPAMADSAAAPEPA